MSENILEMKNITKIYPNGVVANNDVTFLVKEGEIHALMGENGAGKSTLMKILFGTEEFDSGKIFFKGKELLIKNSSDAIKSGIGMVHQHFMLVNSLSVCENVFLGMEPKKNFSTDYKSGVKMVNELSDKYRLQVDPEAKVSELSVGLKQKVEILKVLARDAKLLILDEPTAVLTPQETEELFQQLILLKEAGHTIIFISHKIKEILKICDRITVLRGGKYIGTMEVENATEEEISRFMVGRDVILQMDKPEPEFGKNILEVENISFKDINNKQVLKNVSFNVRAGQILGIAGVEGNGQGQLATCIFGMDRVTSGKIKLMGRNIENESIPKIRELGVAYIPEDRMTVGVCKDISIWENIVSDRIDDDSLKKHGLIDHKKIKNETRELIEEYNILCIDENQQVGMLSGGNMQKVVVAREFSSNPVLLIANQPTRGIDVGANEFIWKEIIKLRDSGKGIILISSDLNEIMELSDSILVMCEGEVSGYFENSKEVSESELGMHMLGIKKQHIKEENRVEK